MEKDRLPDRGPILRAGFSTDLANRSLVEVTSPGNVNRLSSVCVADYFSPWDDQIVPALGVGPRVCQGTCPEGMSIGFAEFVESKFIPEYVMKKRTSGRSHFQAILKHILSPERAASAFGVDASQSRMNLKAFPGWPYLDAAQLSEVTSADVQLLVSASLNRGYSAQMATHIRNVIRSIFSYATTSGHFFGTNPATVVTVSAMPCRHAHVLTLAQLKQVMGLMRYPEAGIALLALLTDMNVAEICGLKWKYVNLSTDRLRVDNEQLAPKTIAVRMQNYRGEYRAVMGGRNKTSPIPDLLFSILRELRHQSAFTAPDDFVLASRSGTPINPDNIALRRLKSIGYALEMPWLSWRVFHRTRISLRAEYGRYFNNEVEKALASKPQMNRDSWALSGWGSIR